MAVFSLRSVIQTVTHFLFTFPALAPPLPSPLFFIYFLSFRIFFLHHCIDVNHTKIFTRLKIVLNLCLRCPFFFTFLFTSLLLYSLFLYSTPNPHFFTLTLFSLFSQHPFLFSPFLSRSQSPSCFSLFFYSILFFSFAPPPSSFTTPIFILPSFPLFFHPSLFFFFSTLSRRISL